MTTDHQEALYHVTHSHPEGELGLIHEKCKAVTVKRLREDSQVRYLPEEHPDIMPLYTTNLQLISMTHEHGTFSCGEAIHKNCRAIICRKLHENSTMRYLYGGRELKIMGEDGLLHDV